MMTISVDYNAITFNNKTSWYAKLMTVHRIDSVIIVCGNTWLSSYLLPTEVVDIQGDFRSSGCAWATWPEHESEQIFGEFRKKNLTWNSAVHQV